MKQILLAIDGEVPSRPVFQYAAGLCERVTASLCILQFLKKHQAGSPVPGDYPGSRKTDKGSDTDKDRLVESKKMWRTGERLDGLPESLKKMLKPSLCGVPFSVALSADRPEDVLSGYIASHHDIILTVFDPSRVSERTPKRIRLLKETLGVPLVVVGKRKKAGAV